MIKKLKFFQLTIVSLFAFCSFVQVTHAIISNGANAIDLIGQYSDGSYTPSYTKTAANGLPHADSLSGPEGMVIDPINHRLFISDNTNNRVLVHTLNSSDEMIDKVPDFVLGQPDFYSNTATDTQSGLCTPQGLAYDATGNRLFVAEYGCSRVKVFDVTAITNGENAINILGQTDFVGTSFANTQSGLSFPLAHCYTYL